MDLHMKKQYIILHPRIAIRVGVVSSYQDYNSPNDFYREKITSQFKEKVKEMLEKEINLNDN